VIYEALYSPNLGLVGFRCRHSVQCKKLTRTERGMWMHLLRVHKIKRQGGLFDGQNNEASTATDGRVVRAASTRAEQLGGTSAAERDVSER